MFKVQVQTMIGEWKDCGKLSEFIDGTWKTKEFTTENAARAAAIAAYPDHYPEHSDNATFRIVSCNKENEMKTQYSINSGRAIAFQKGWVRLVVSLSSVYWETCENGAWGNDRAAEMTDGNVVSWLDSFKG